MFLEKNEKRFKNTPYPFSLPPEGGSTRVARGRNGDLGDRDNWEGEGVPTSTRLSESALFFSCDWGHERYHLINPTLNQTTNHSPTSMVSVGGSIGITLRAEGSIPGNRGIL